MKLKRFLGLLLAVLMLAACMSFTTSADTTYEVVMENVTAYKNQHNISFNDKTIARKNDGYTLSNGIEVPFSINYEGTNYLPARKLAEILGITIGYDADTRTVLVDTKTENTTDALDGIVKDSKNSGEAKISVAKNSVIINVDGKNVVSQNENFKTQSGTEVPCSLIYEGTTYLPVRKLAELLKVGIDYDSASGTVLIEKEEEEVVIPGTAVALSNTYYKLTQEKKLTVAYIGGSVTAGYGATYAPDDCWPAQIGRWLKEKYPDAEISNNNMPIGGTGSYSATFRYDYEIAPLNPDLLFVEYVINDWGATGSDGSKLTYDQVTRTAESIVRQAYEVNPNIDIIFVLTFNSGTRDSDFTELIAHRDVAQHYNLPYIKMGERFYAMLEETGQSFNSLYIDHVHPNTKGYLFYGQEIIGLIEDELKKAETAAVDSIVAHVLPETNVSKDPLMMNATLVTPDKIDLTGAKGWRYEPKTAFTGCGLRYNGLLYGKDLGSKFTFTFTGTDFGIFAGGDYSAGAVECIIDENPDTRTRVDAYQYRNPVQKIVYENLEYGEHTVEIVIVQKNSQAEGKSNYFEIGALFYN